MDILGLYAIIANVRGMSRGVGKLVVMQLRGRYHEGEEMTLKLVTDLEDINSGRVLPLFGIGKENMSRTGQADTAASERWKGNALRYLYQVTGVDMLMSSIKSWITIQSAVIDGHQTSSQF